MANNTAREDLFKALSYLCDHVIYGGGVSPVDFRSYVFCTIFYRFLSEDIQNFINSNERVNNASFEYADMADADAEAAREEVTAVKGFFILPSELFCNFVKNMDEDENINEHIVDIFRHIQDSSNGYESAENFAGLFDSFNIGGNLLGANLDAKRKQIRILFQKISEIDFGGNNNDLLGDAYEFLMSWYAAHAGKKGGQFFTPACVSELLAKIALHGREKVNKVYDGACGSGSLLLKANKILGKENVIDGFYGQELDFETERLCRMNMFMHGVPYTKFCIRQGDTLTNPRHDAEQPFQCIVMNPPYSVPWDGENNAILINDRRFSPAGVLAPKSKADFAFIMHALSYLSNDGTAAIVTFPGIMRRGGAEQKIRKYLIDSNFVDAVIQMPSSLFYSTDISVDLLVLKKSRTDNKVLFIDASEFFTHATNQNELSDNNLEEIYKLYAERKEVSHKAHLTNFDEISDNDYNLSVSTYVETKDTREKVDITKLNAELEGIVAKENELRAEIDKIIKEIEG